jgi:hypothetical protein
MPHCLKLALLSASGLSKADVFGKSDPYCVVKVNGDSQYKSSIIKKTLNPHWNEEVELKFEDYSEDFAQTVITFEVFDHDVVGSHDFLGQAQLRGDVLRTFLKSDEILTSFTLKNEQGSEVTKGDLTLKLISLQIEEVARIEGVADRFVLSVRLVGATRLRAADVSGASDPYAVVTFAGEKVGKTKVAKKTLNPRWDQTFRVLVDPDIPKLASSSLVFEIHDHDLLGGHDFLGIVDLSGMKLLQFLLTRESIQFLVANKTNGTKSDRDDYGKIEAMCVHMLDLDGRDILKKPNFIKTLKASIDASNSALEAKEMQSNQLDKKSKGQAVQEKEQTFSSQWPQWERFYDSKAHAMFWYNNFSGEVAWKEPFDYGVAYRTKERLWDPPQCFIKAQAALKIESMSRSYFARYKTRKARARKQVVGKRQLWVEAFDPRLRQSYFYNMVTGTVKWRRPMEMLATQNRWIKSFDPDRKISYFYNYTNHKWQYDMPDEFTPGGFHKKNTAAECIQSSYRGFRSRCVNCLKNMTKNACHIHNSHLNLSLIEYLEQFSWMYRHRYTRKSAKIRSKLLDLRIELDKIRQLGAALTRKPAELLPEDAEDAATQNYLDTIELFGKHVSNSAALIATEDVDIFRVARSQLREMLSLDIYRLQILGLETNSDLILVKSEIDKAKLLVSQFQIDSNVKRLLKRKVSKKDFVFDGNYVTFVKLLYKVTKQVYRALETTKKFLLVTGKERDVRISQVELLRMRKEEAKQLSAMYILEMRAKAKAAHSTFVTMCKSRWELGKQKKDSEENLRIETEKKRQLEEARRRKDREHERYECAAKTARDMISPWAAIKTNVPLAVFRDLLRAEMERKIYQEKRNFSINDKCPETGESFVGNATTHGKSEILEYLMQVRANPNLVESILTRVTPLHVAAKNDRRDCARILINYGANLCAVDSYGDTALHVACRQDRMALVKLLISVHMDDSFWKMIAVPNHKGMIPMDLAKNQSIISTLKPFLKNAMHKAQLSTDERRLLDKRDSRIHLRSTLNATSKQKPVSLKTSLCTLPLGELATPRSNQEETEICESEKLKLRLSALKRKH